MFKKFFKNFFLNLERELTKCDREKDEEDWEEIENNGEIEHATNSKSNDVTQDLTSVVNTSYAPVALGSYSQGIISASGSRLSFISGCIALDPHSTARPQTLVDGGINEQTIQCLKNLKEIILKADGNLQNMCKVTFLLSDISDYNTVNSIYDNFLKSEGVTKPPARTTFAVAAIPAKALIEIDAIVVLKG